MRRILQLPPVNCMEESDILCLYRNGERHQAFNLMMRRYSESLYWHLRSMVQCHEDADDLLQNTWLRVWNSLDTFRAESRLYTWLYRIATNEAITFLNRSRQRAMISLSSYTREVYSKIAEDDNLSADRIQLALQHAIAKLPPRQKAVFTMRYYDEMPYEDMAEILEVSASSLKASYHHAREKVEQSMKNELDR